MSVAAALAVGVACALLAGALMGTLPAFRVHKRGERRARTETWLQQAGVPLTPTRFVLGSAGAGILALFVLTALTGSLLVAIVPAVALALLPRTYFTRRRRTRLREVQSAWPDGLRDLAASIAAGHSLTQAVTELARHGPEALRHAFARFPGLARVLGTAAALEIVKEELADPTSVNTNPYRRCEIRSGCFGGRASSRLQIGRYGACP
jgi:tight adherence protein B